MDFKQYLREYAERELELTGFLQTEFGKTCLKFLDDLADVAGEDPESMKTVAEIVFRLIDKKPLSLITDNDFESIPDQKGRYRCTRYPYIYKDADGKAYNDRHFGFMLDETNKCVYIYQENLTSKKEISFPYVVTDRIKPYN